MGLAISDGLLGMYPGEIAVRKVQERHVTKSAAS
jgi:hypothetical protein